MNDGSRRAPVTRFARLNPEFLCMRFETRTQRAIQLPPPVQRKVGDRAERVVRPRGAPGRSRPVEVGHPVATRTVEGSQPRRGAREQPARHRVEGQLTGLLRGRSV